MTVFWAYPCGAPTSCDGSAATCTLVIRASAVIPTKMTIVRPPMIASVAAALRLDGFRKLGTPLLTASTPVSAVHPDANARSSSSASSSPENSPVECTLMLADSARGASPVAVDQSPTAIITNMQAMKPYVGTAKYVPDSLTPRRFISARTATNPPEISTAWGPRVGNAETMLDTPAATETAT